MNKFGYKSAAQRKKNLRYGGYATVVTLIALVVLVVVTVLFEQLDLSANKMYTPSEATMNLLDNLEDDVEIYGLYSTGTETGTYYAEVVRLMEQYARICDKISYETIDTLKNPNFVKDYIDEDSSATTVADGSVVVKNARTGKYRLLGIMEFYDYTNTTNKSLDTFCAEEALSTAVQYVTSNRIPVLYQLMGHGEEEMDSTFKSYMKTTNFDFELLNLATMEEEELEANLYTVVMINNPKTDLKEEEYQILLDYMERGGRMLILLDYETPDTLTNFNRLLARYGLSFTAGGSYVEETAYSNYYAYPFVILPKMAEEHDITSALTGANSYLTMLHAVPIQIADKSELNRRTEITTLLTTSDTAQSVKWINMEENIEILGDGNVAYVTENGEQVVIGEYLAEEKDKDTNEILRVKVGLSGPGQYNLAVVAKETSTQGNDIVETRLVVIGNSSFVDYTNNRNYITTGNYKMIASTLNYLQDEVSNLYITSKSLSAGKIATSLGDFIGGFAIFAIVLPLAVIIAGVVIWVRRRHL